MKILIGLLVISSILSLVSQVSLAESEGFQTPSAARLKFLPRKMAGMVA